MVDGSIFEGSDGGSLAKHAASLNRRDASRHTINAYRRVVKRICRDLGKTPDQLVVDLKTLTPEELQGFMDKLLDGWKAAGDSSGTRNSKFSIIKRFLIVNGVINAKLVQSGLKTTIKNDDQCPTDAQIRQIINNASEIGEAVIYALIESGQRIGTTTSLTWGDLGDQLDNDDDVLAVWFESDRTKCKIAHWALFGPNTKRCVKQIREKLRRQNIEPQPSDKVFCRSKHGKLKGYSMRQLQYEIDAAMMKAGVRGEGRGIGRYRRYACRVHTLRKVFQTTMEHAHVPEPVIWALMGKRKDTYSKWSLEDLKDEYRRAMTPVARKNIVDRILDDARQKGYNIDPNAYKTEWPTPGDQSLLDPSLTPLVEYYGRELINRMDENHNILVFSDTGGQAINLDSAIIQKIAHKVIYETDLFIDQTPSPTFSMPTMATINVYGGS